MSDRFITYVIIGVAFGFTQLWFAYWVVKLYKEKQRLLKARRVAAATVAAATAVKSPAIATAETDGRTGDADGPPAGPAAGV